MVEHVCAGTCDVPISFVNRIQYININFIAFSELIFLSKWNYAYKSIRSRTYVFEHHFLAQLLIKIAEILLWCKAKAKEFVSTILTRFTLKCGWKSRLLNVIHNFLVINTFISPTPPSFMLLPFPSQSRAVTVTVFWEKVFCVPSTLLRARFRGNDFYRDVAGTP